MAFFVDANVLAYALSESEYREGSAAVLESIAQGTGEGVTSTAALEEFWHLELSGRIPGLAGATKEAWTYFAPLLPVTDDIFRRALSVEAAGLGANDRIHAATCEVNGIGVIVSADKRFDEVVGLRRVDPLNNRAIARLLKSQQRPETP